MAKHTLPPLPYDVSALEPYIDARTLELHHDHHHASYVKSLNIIVESTPALADKNAVWLLANASKVPEKFRAAIRFNAGGHVNHSLLWRTMSPGGGGLPNGALADAINQSFYSFENFKAKFEKIANQVLGPGWIWLVQERYGDKRLKILTTNGHDNPISQGYLPLLVNDLWEHAYYLKHENRRADYLHHWWSVVHWEEVAERLAQSQEAFTSTRAMNDLLFDSDVVSTPVLLQALK
jgi:Fe-Mn family superoxide dismutase